EPRPGRGVLDEPAEPRDLVADLVATLEVASRPRVAARGEELLHLSRRPIRCGLAREEPEHATELDQLVDAGHERASGLGAAIARVGQGASEVEEHAERLRGVEVVVHRALEARAEFGERLRQRHSRAAIAHRGRVVNQPAQALEGALALLNALLR